MQYHRGNSQSALSGVPAAQGGGAERNGNAGSGAGSRNGGLAGGCYGGGLDGSMELVAALEEEGVDVEGLRVDVSYACPMQKGVESFSPALGLAPESLVPYLY